MGSQLYGPAFQHDGAGAQRAARIAIRLFAEKPKAFRLRLEQLWEHARKDRYARLRPSVLSTPRARDHSTDPRRRTIMGAGIAGSPGRLTMITSISAWPCLIA